MPDVASEHFSLSAPSMEHSDDGLERVAGYRDEPPELPSRESPISSDPETTRKKAALVDAVNPLFLMVWDVGRGRGVCFQLRRRADTRYGIDDALTSNQHREPTVGSLGSPEFTDSTPPPPPTVFDRSEPKFREYHSTNRDLIRRHSSQSPRGRLLREPSPLTLVELRSSSDTNQRQQH
uniref:Uncharacterized protein n=1 Tax=Brassica campestris TaxID=3711 RepID=M4EBY2_BRACM